MDLDAAMADVVGALVADGIRATDDLRELNPPGVYVAPPRLRFNRLAGYTAEFDLHVVAPAAGRRPALKVLGPLLSRVQLVWPGPAADPYDLQTLGSPDPLPGYRVTVTLHVCDADDTPDPITDPTP